MEDSFNIKNYKVGHYYRMTDSEGKVSLCRVKEINASENKLIVTFTDNDGVAFEKRLKHIEENKEA